MSGSLKFFLILLMLALFFVVGSGYFFSWINAAFVAGFIIVMLVIARPLLMPAGYGTNKIRTLVLVLGMGAISSTSTAINSLLSGIWTLPGLQHAPAWLKNSLLVSQPSWWVSAILGIIIIAVFYFTRSDSVSGVHPVPLKKDFPDESFPRQLKSFCHVLRKDLEAIDEETDWSPNHYTELEAEVEIRKTRHSRGRKKVMGLQEAIRRDQKTGAFLVLGVPGSGKSVALRKLAQDMLAEVKRTNRVPIYVNLREWMPQITKVNGRTEFSVEDLEGFIIKNLSRRGDVFTTRFVANYFRKLWSSGRLFFIFDSFDEISPLLDAREDSDVIHALSSVLGKFIASHPASRGLLASRIYRRPTSAFQAEKVLEIRPLSETHITYALSHYPRFTPALRNTLFSLRQDLMPLARNPFIMALLGEWIAGNDCLPVNQAEIYKNYIDERLKLCEEYLRESQITAQEVIDVTTDIAWFVFHEPTLGLEAPVKVINARIKSDKVGTVLEILRHAKIARVTTGPERSFAFVHRRFLEYFVTTRFLQRPQAVPDNHIPTDARGRDALVLYAQLCQDAEAQRLANLCWHEIMQHFADPHHRLRAIHSLRFLIDAFGSRRDVLQPFAEELSAFVTGHVKEGQNILLAKVCLETTGLLREADAEPVLASAIAIGDAWLQETAFRACRHLARVKPALEDELKRYVLAIPEIGFWHRRKAILLSLSLSDALSRVYRIAQLRVWNMRLAMVAVLALVVTLPFITLFSASYALAITLAMMLMMKAGGHVQRKTPEKAAAKASPARRSTSFLDKDFLSAAIMLFRGITSVVLLVLSVLGLYSPTLANVVTPFYLITGHGHYTSLLAALNVVLSMMLLDWVVISRFIRSKMVDLLNWRKWLTALSILLFAALLVVGVFFSITYLSQFPLAEPIFNGVFRGLVVAFVGYLLYLLLRGVYTGVCDIRMQREKQFGTTITRSEIAEVFTKCKSDYGRRRFVTWLDNAGLGATGEWPEGFTLTVGRSAPYTALSRLEERWLGLDR
ncbi:NACHT domain-containing protein [Kosakonia cowanii]|uniref:NACHT domain-containing protein n=1 Tax=Kosakonia cowanii TaxID=208223 RepID=UPI0028996843|nr:NACHT domain-containing protein [Kosakonia cowanii]